MPQGRAQISVKELKKVLSHYDIGAVQQTRRISGGSKHAPKLVIISDRGKYLLKRRPEGKDNLYHIDFTHAIQKHLASKSFPAAKLLATIDDERTILRLDDRIYELFEFIKGMRYDGSEIATTDAGRQLANLHDDMANFVFEPAPVKSSFHDSLTIRHHLKTAGTVQNNHINEAIRDVAAILMELYNSGSVRVNELGFDSWPKQVVHGDWHPGNMLFTGRRLVAVLDFDSAKIATPVTDLANGMLQFSIVGGRPNPADWPSYLDQAKLTQFLKGYREVIELDSNKLRSLPDLMIETMIAESILPIAATGFFGHLSGSDFLKMIHRKTSWIDENREMLIEAMNA